MKYGFIGFGNLAKAIYEGLKKDESIDFLYFDKNKIENLEISKVGSLEDLVTSSDVVWICVKPQNIDEVFSEIKNFDLKNKVFVSPVAGLSINFFENNLGKISIVRIMPNLAIAYGKSVTAFCVNHKEDLLVNNIKESLEKLGKVVEIEEKDFDLFTAIFGSGPAFLLEVFKVFKDRMLEFGMNEKEANESLSLLIDGTETYFNKNNEQKSISVLTENIASKGGITEVGLKAFRDNKIDELLNKVLNSARDRSKEMTK